MRSIFTELMKNVCVVFDKCITLHNKTRFIESMPDMLYKVWTIKLFQIFANLVD